MRRSLRPLSLRPVGHKEAGFVSAKWNKWGEGGGGGGGGGGVGRREGGKKENALEPNQSSSTSEH